MAPGVGMPGGPPTSAAGLQQRISEMEGRLKGQPRDLSAAVLLSDALIRQARATNDARPANRASQVLKTVLKEEPRQYDALRMLGAIKLSQHRFREALELGDYDKAFDSFDKMMSLRPSAAAYARVAYARELRGEPTGALEAMQLAFSASAPQDPEAQAWHATQVGELLLKLGRIPDADREFRRAVFFYPTYPLAMIGQGKVRVARGEMDEALTLYLDQLKRTPMLDLAARIGDLYAQRVDAAQAERYYQMAEDLAGPAIAQTEANLALFLAEHDRKIPEAVKIAESVASTRNDIFTADALAWSYFKAGRLNEASAASQRALRTGTKDERILTHAARIREAAGQRGGRP